MNNFDFKGTKISIKQKLKDQRNLKKKIETNRHYNFEHHISK